MNDEGLAPQVVCPFDDYQMKKPPPDLGLHLFPALLHPSSYVLSTRAGLYPRGPMKLDSAEDCSGVPSSSRVVWPGTQRGGTSKNVQKSCAFCSPVYVAQFCNSPPPQAEKTE